MFDGSRGRFAANFAREMHTVVVLVLGLGAIGQTISSAEKVVFIVPRAKERNFATNASPFTVPRHPRELVDHVVIPHGESVSYGISYGKGYVPDNEFGGEPVTGSRPRFSAASENYLGYADVVFPKSTGQDQPWNNNADSDKARFEFRGTGDNFDLPESPAPADDYLSHPEQGPLEAFHNSVAPIIPEGRTMTPIVLRDTIDVGEYLAKMEMLARSWPYSDDLAKFYGENQPSHTWGAAGSGEGYRVREELPESETTRR